MFICTGIVIQNYSDGDSYRVSDQESRVDVEADTIELLLERMASELVHQKAGDNPKIGTLSEHTRTTKKFARDIYWVIEWGAIFEVVGEGQPVPATWPKGTAAWENYLLQIAADQKASELKTQAVERDRVALQEKSERATYEKLKKKYEGGA